MIAKAIAKSSNFTFFNISASTLTSKWIGEGEKMVKTLFSVARVQSPSVVFIDEIDSLLTARSDTENEASRRMKTEFLVCMDGVGAEFDQQTLDSDTPGTGRVLLVGATNRPQELDDAARRRLVKRLYIPLPDREARAHMILHLMKTIDHTLGDSDIAALVDLTPGYSGADMKGLCQEAAQLPVRGIDLATAKAEDVRPVNVDDFRVATRNCKPSVSPDDLEQYRVWNSEFGSFQFEETS
jgi:fidgetin-like protein 1